MTTKQATARIRFEQLPSLVESALIDFELRDRFYSRSTAERAGCMRWIGAAAGERAREERVAEMLDCLDSGSTLPRLD